MPASSAALSTLSIWVLAARLLSAAGIAAERTRGCGRDGQRLMTWSGRNHIRGALVIAPSRHQSFGIGFRNRRGKDLLSNSTSSCPRRHSHSKRSFGILVHEIERVCHLPVVRGCLRRARWIDRCNGSEPPRVPVRDPAEDVFERPMWFVKISLRGNLVGSYHILAVY